MSDPGPQTRGMFAQQGSNFFCDLVSLLNVCLNDKLAAKLANMVVHAAVHWLAEERAAQP